MKYNYNTPEMAVKSLEKAYTIEDLDGVFESKDFKAEAFLMLKRQGKPFDPYDIEQLKEMEDLVKLTLLKGLEENGYPDFAGSHIELSDLTPFIENIYVANEKIIYSNETLYFNKVYLSFNNEQWKVAMVEVG